MKDYFIEENKVNCVFGIFLMDTKQFEVSCCQRCRHFTLAGRRGGHCSQLNVNVKGCWSACSLASPVFLEPVTPLAAPQFAVWPTGLKLTRPDFESAELVPRHEAAIAREIALEPSQLQS
mgnify:CR=1 FL=1